MDTISADLLAGTLCVVTSADLLLLMWTWQGCLQSLWCPVVMFNKMIRLTWQRLFFWGLCLLRLLWKYHVGQEGKQQTLLSQFQRRKISNQVPAGSYPAVNSLPADKWPPPYCVLLWRGRKGFLVSFLIRSQFYECKMGTFMNMIEETGRGDEKG